MTLNAIRKRCIAAYRDTSICDGCRMQQKQIASWIDELLMYKKGIYTDNSISDVMSLDDAIEHLIDISLKARNRSSINMHLTLLKALLQLKNIREENKED